MDSLYTRYVWAYNDDLHSVASTLAQTTTTTQWICGQEFLDQRDGQTYNTVSINGKCWMTENMNVGTMVNGTTAQTNNGNIEKYCYEDNPSNCSTYGGLYQGDEAVQYNLMPGTQGVCPQGWHIPEDWEWTELTDISWRIRSSGW